MDFSQSFLVHLQAQAARLGTVAPMHSPHSPSSSRLPESVSALPAGPTGSSTPAAPDAEPPASSAARSSGSPNSEAQRRFLKLAHDRFRAGAAAAQELGLIRVRVSDVDPPFVTTSDGRRLLNFASCCYLETAYRPEVLEASLAATRRFGTQLSLSPTYMAVDLYDTLTEKVSSIVGTPVVIAATTTLGHFGALPGLVPSGALVVVDRQAHNSLQMASRLLAGSGYEVTHVPHSDLEALESLAVSDASRPVWYVADGVYSMFGDEAPYEDLLALLGRHENLWVYVDDAHGVGWSGVRGRGRAADFFAGHPRAVLALGLSKSWGSGGAAISLPSFDMVEAVLSSPSPFVFSGPLKPAELGAGVASADFHLSDAYLPAADRLQQLIDHTIAETDRLGLDLVDRTRTPIFFLRVGETSAALELGSKLLVQGFYVNVSAFPVVPRGQAGIRFTVTTALTEDLITNMLTELRELI